MGKSTVAVNLASALALHGLQVGLLDVDIHGPSVPTLLDMVGTTLNGDAQQLFPARKTMGTGSLFVMSVGFLLENQDQALIWRGPRKFGLIRQFLSDVQWGDLDVLVVDSPPGTGDEPMAVAQLVEKADGAVIVTTPQDVAVRDVRRCVTFCRQVNLPILGVVENMSGFVCPQCGTHYPIFGAGGGQSMAHDLDIPFLGAIPIDPQVVVSGDTGQPILQSHPRSPTAQAMQRVMDLLGQTVLSRAHHTPVSP